MGMGPHSISSAWTSAAGATFSCITAADIFLFFLFSSLFLERQRKRKEEREREGERQKRLGGLVVRACERVTRRTSRKGERARGEGRSEEERKEREK